MRRYLPKSRWINNRELVARGGRYEGIIGAVLEQEVENRYAEETEKIQRVPVIEFTDRLKVIPNIPMRRQLIDRLGPDSDTWIGARLVIVFRPCKGRKNGPGKGPEDGTKHLDWTQCAKPEDVLREGQAVEREPGWESEVIPNDDRCDDVNDDYRAVEPPTDEEIFGRDKFERVAETRRRRLGAPLKGPEKAQ